MVFISNQFSSVVCALRLLSKLLRTKVDSDFSFLFTQHLVDSNAFKVDKVSRNRKIIHRKNRIDSSRLAVTFTMQVGNRNDEESVFCVVWLAVAQGCWGFWVCVRGVYGSSGSTDKGVMCALEESFSGSLYLVICILR